MKKYQYRVEVHAYDFIFADGEEALIFARSAAEHSIPNKYSGFPPVICMTIEEVPEEEPKEQEGDNDQTDLQ